MFEPYGPTMFTCSTPKANIAITGTVSHCQTWHRWSILTTGLRILDVYIHAGEVNPPPAPQPAVHSASPTTGIEAESILFCRLLIFQAASQVMSSCFTTQKWNKMKNPPLNVYSVIKKEWLLLCIAILGPFSCLVMYFSYLCGPGEMYMTQCHVEIFVWAATVTFDDRNIYINLKYQQEISGFDVNLPFSPCRHFW